MKKILIILLAVIVLSTSIYATGDKPSDWAKDVVGEIFASDLLDDRMKGDYQGEISRKDFAYLGVVIYERITGQKSEVGDAQFPDSDDIYVLKAKNIGVVNGYEDGTFRPNQKINRQELAVLFINTLVATNQSLEIDEREIFIDDEDVAGWAKKSVYTARALGVVKGVGENKFEPLGTATREQSMLMFKRLIDRYAETEQPTTEQTTEPSTEEPGTQPTTETTTEQSTEQSQTETESQTEQVTTKPSTTLPEQTEPLPTIDIVDFSSDTLSGKVLNFADYRDKPIVLIFFTAQCQPCLDQLLTVNDIYQKHSTDYHFIGVNLTKRDTLSDLKRLVERYNITYDIVLDAGSLTQTYQITALPTTVLIDDGKLIDYYVGTMTTDFFEQFITNY